MTQKHTPAPWKITMSGRTPEGSAHKHQIGDYNSRTIAYAYCQITDKKDQTFHEHNANARLITAAPELLEALENIIDHYNSKDGDMKLLRHFISEGEKAITKARGGVA